MGTSGPISVIGAKKPLELLCLHVCSVCVHRYESEADVSYLPEVLFTFIFETVFHRLQLDDSARLTEQ